MDTRSSRSRSRTPFVQSLEQTELSSEKGEHYEETVVRTTRSSTMVKSFENVSAWANSISAKTSKSKPNRRRTRYKTSDYSSEEGEAEIVVSSSGGHVSENERNQLIEDARSAANGAAQVSALGLYRKAGRYWDIYPKTDWTYSRSSRDRVELAPGVVAMPNMSRRSLHSQERSSEHLLTHRQTEHNSVKHRPRSLFTDDNYNEEYEYSSTGTSYEKRTSFVRKVAYFFLTIVKTVFTVLYGGVVYQKSWVLWVGKKMHRAASLLMLWDTWLLRGNTSKGDKVGRALLLCLLPLLLFGGWYSVSALGQAIYGAYFNNTSEVPVINELTNDLTQEQLEKIVILLKDREERMNLDLIVKKVLPEIQKVAFDDEAFKKQETVINGLRGEIDRMRDELKYLENSKNEDINRILTQIKSDNLRVMHSLRRCCRRSSVDVETYVANAVKDIFNNPSNHEELSRWLRSIFVAKQDLEDRLTNLTQNLITDFDITIKQSGERMMNEVASKLSVQLKESHNKDIVIDSFTDENVRRIVKDVLSIYDADKTGLVDYAMEPMGGQVITTRCTESYQARTAVVSVLGIPLWFPTNTPRTVITPGINPGECWAFQNFPGFLVVKLAAPVKISAVSYEHISKKLIANGKIDSAPKQFEVYGLKNETDKEPILLGSFRYDYDGEPLQFFEAVNSEGLVFETIELRVLSNHGNPNYTCLYRFRVHGSVSNEPR